MGISVNKIGEELKKPSEKKPKVSGANSVFEMQLFSRKHFSDKKREGLFSELAMLINSGLDLSTSINLLIEQEENKDDKEVYASVYKRLVQGKSFSEALKETNKFSDYDYYSIKMGEESGFFGEVLNELSLFYRKKIKYRRKIVSAISYPLLVLFSAVFALFFMLKYLVPAFSDIFKRTNNELPQITKIVVKLSDIVSESFYIVLIILVLGIIFCYANKSKIWYKQIYSKVILKIPLFGGIVRIFYLERFFISMVLLTKSRVPLVSAIHLSRLMINFYPFEMALLKIEGDIIKGKLLSDSMKAYSLFDKKIITLVKVGEEVNQLGSVFERLSQQHSNELDHKIESISTFLEPVLILFVGVIVAIILIAMYLPIFQMGSTIQ